MKQIILLLLSICLSVEASEFMHSNTLAYYENKIYNNSKQKKDAVTYGIGTDISHNKSTYKITYEYSQANTKQPPLTRNLINKKIFCKYTYALNKDISININYINILNDNIAITSGGRSYGAGLNYNFDKKLTGNFTQYFTEYKDFKAYQSDLKMDYKTKLNSVGIKFSFIAKYIKLETNNKNIFTKNAKDNYFTPAIKIHAHYKSYHFGAGAYFGKRVFAIMNDGFKIQHHAMEFDKTYAVGIGKNLSNFVLRFQYIYQRATELPMLNENVELKISRFILNYKF